VLTQNQSTHTLLLPELYIALGYLPEVEVIHEAYDFPDVPERVKKPGSDAPLIPAKPEPPVEPGAFVSSDDDDPAEVENERNLHDLAAEAYPQAKELYDNKTSHEWRQYETSMATLGHAVVENEDNWKAYNAYKNLQEERRVKMIVSPWRYGTYTPTLCSAGDNLFRKDIRENHFPDSIIEVGKRGFTKPLMCITEETEAYGLLQYENCRDRWEATFNHLDQFPDAPVPQYNHNDPSTNAFKAKWSDDGQGSGSGWGTKAFAILDDWLEAIQHWRKAEKASKYKRWAAARAACKELEDEYP
jgi:hypothetical protein